jgi:hypothetical protein
MKSTIDMARDCGLDIYGLGWPRDKFIGRLEAFEALVRADEREACAKLVEEIEARCVAKDVDDPPLAHVAAAIRARGKAMTLECQQENPL